MRKLAHIINPVAVKESSDLFIAQPVTFESLRVAKQFADSAVEVSQYTAQYPEDHSIIPDSFVRTSDLDRSVLDLGAFQVPRKLPLIGDILGRLYDASDAEYFIYSNVDIALMPNFYVTVNAIIEAGYDAFVINRRTIPSQYRSARELPLMYAEVGHSHPGYDCFIFRRECVPRFLLGSMCIGASKIGVALTANLICFARRFKEFADVHMTFHIGNDRAWRNPTLNDYFIHNKNEAQRILSSLAPMFDLNNLPEVGMPGLIEYFAWLKNNSKSFP